MSSITLTVNGRKVTQELDPAMPLLYFLSDDLALRGPKLGCGLAQCGSCTVLANGEPIPSCVTPVGTLEGAHIVTLEGLGTLEHPHPIQQAFIDEQATQCGFCLNGIILRAQALLDRQPNASDAQIRQALANVLCRCGANVRILRAIRRYADAKAKASA
jgi:nicotinate dehydrogenase subunit A